MVSTEAKLKERIKELTCLYEVTSIIVNSDYSQLHTSLEAITFCLKKAWQFEDDTEVLLQSGDYDIKTDGYHNEMVYLKSNIRVFNEVSGFIKVGYPKKKYKQTDFLVEEEKLLENVALAVGNLLERKQVHDSEAAIKRQVERADRLHILGEITAGIAHEINTPLANILGFTELLKERITDTDALRDLNKIVDNAIFSREVVKKLMFFACEMPQQMNVIQVIPLIEDVLNLLGPSIRTKNIQLVKSFSHQDIALRADNVQLTQVLFNLIMNAIYFSPKGGKIEINLKKGTKYITLRITDEGSGIALENEDKVFEPFFTTKPLGEGSGLGLSVVHGIISSHKGTITHGKNHPQGTIFTISFPKLP
ncbi:HAMP domain-containing sensor histidine kinase [Maribacter confluentis]|uniref:histidine kinase n=2 Tax=Maribacter TaxID=252356 RepID=A0ABT8RVB9_9FLAO|nr:MULTISPECIES: HAMP domain-containing sensor histidine kinase [Maribacter]MDO1513403.1 HAMP domain-containing sensor histidine kinase [Maribacter confluentis]MDO1514853.1 HAMP domain-containing sensor histidine kinase [Maribacter confluentis]SNR28232.1 His Kinase A (phospho-acceptor) domain-containing protein [Maribacter sedimenticola]